MSATHPTHRERCIARGTIVPKVFRRVPAVLKLDAAGRAAAQQHIAEYWEAPREWQERSFYQEPPEWLA
jgi:hypothetical protein